MGKIRILEVNKAYCPHIGGIETLVQQYSEKLSEYDDIEVKVLVCRDGKGSTIHENANGTDLTRAGSLGTYFSCPVSLSFIRLFRDMSENADAVHIHFPFPLADLALLLSGYKGKVILSWHSDIVRQKKLMFFYKPLMNYLLERADVILTATKGHIKYSDFLWKYRKKCRILPYGINPDDYCVYGETVLKSRYKGSVKVFFTGRLVYYKGVDVLLKAFREVISRNINCELFIAGEGVLESGLKEYTDSCGLADRIHFLGFLPETDLKSAYNACDIFVLPSTEKSEAFGIVQIEAMACGKPVINTRLPSGVPYVSKNGVTGITVRPKNVPQLADAIEKLCTDPELRKEYGRNGAERVNRYFSEEKIIRKLYSIIKEDLF